MALLFRSRERLLYRLIGPVLTAVGLVLVLYGLAFHRESLTSEGVAVAFIGTIAISTGWALSVFYSMMQMAHEVLLRVDEDPDTPRGSEAEDRQEVSLPRADDAGSGFDPPSRSDLRKLSTRSLTAGWRMLVMVSTVVGALLLSLSMCALWVSTLGEFVDQFGVRLEHLCLAGLLLMATGAYMMLFGRT